MAMIFMIMQTNTVEYCYDNNGNLISDLNKGILEIKYNELNLPIEIIKDQNNRIVYLYDAIGNKKQQITYSLENLAGASATGGIIGGWAGAKAGASIGFAVGVWFGGFGAVPGTIIGGFVGGIAGSLIGKKVAESSVNYYYGR